MDKLIEVDLLRHSIELESQADLCAFAFQFVDASRLMREANSYRRKVFGGISDPNELRQRTLEALSTDAPQ